MKIRPLRNMIVVQKNEKDEVQLESGLVLPEIADEEAFDGTVLAVGPGSIDKKGNIVPVSIEVGDRVLFGKYAGQEIEIDKKKYLIMSEDEIISRVKV